MCGRYAVPGHDDLSADELCQSSELDIPADLSRLFNCAPTMTAPVLLNDAGRRAVTMLRWGLVPSWARDEKIGNRMINARAETVASKPAYREAFKARRCAIPALGYFEWRKTSNGKVPYYFTSTSGSLLWLAGLWERWAADPAIVTYCVITTEPNALAGQVHDRMPVLLTSADVPTWIGEHKMDFEKLRALLGPSAPNVLTAWPVSRKVNKPSYQEPDVIEQAGARLQ